MNIGMFIEQAVKARGKDKLHVLRKFEPVQAVRDVLYYTYNQDITYGVRPTVVSPINIISRVDKLSQPELTLLNALSQRVLTGNVAEDAVRKCIKEHGPLLSLILNRDLQCGIAATSINKIMPGLIPQFKVQLAKEVPLAQIKYPCWAQMKYDGVRIIALIHNNKVTFKTRNGKVVRMPKLANLLLDSQVEDMILDGELVFSEGKVDSRTSISGRVNSAIHGGIMNEDNVVFNVFDCMTYQDFTSCYCALPYSIRYRNASVLCNLIGRRAIVIAENYVIDNADEANKLVNRMYKLGFEGLILKHPTHKYTFKRSKDWVKIKQILSVDLTVTDASEGEGKYAGMIGALNCTGIAEGTRVHVYVGSGLSDNDRDVELDFYNGKTIEVKYNSLIKDSKTGIWSLFLPRFVCVRFDK